MNDAAKTILFVLLGICVSTAAWAQTPDHSQMDHAAMGHAPPAVADGPWSYKHRKNPPPYKQGRWEMVPVPQYGHMFINTQGLSAELRCAALDNPGVMVDRATRKACGISDKAQEPRPKIPAAGAAPAHGSDAAGHSGHQH